MADNSSNTLVAPGWLPPLYRRSHSASGLLSKSAWPILDLLIRIWLGQTFLIAGLLKLGNWENALFLATNEYPVSWMSPFAAAALGAAVQVLGGLMIMLGLGTRVAALSMMILSLVIQFAYLEINTHLFWALLFGWYAAAGAGPFSLDRMLGRGFARLPLPLAGPLSHMMELSTRYLSPVYQLVLRLWMAEIFFKAGLDRGF